MFSKNISNNELKFTPTFGTQLRVVNNVCSMNIESYEHIHSIS